MSRLNFSAYPLFLLVLLPLLACTRSGDSGTPQTVSDQTEPDTRSDEAKIAGFTLELEKKYKREELHNAIDLHFTTNGPARIKIRLTYDRQTDPTLVSSIADSAVELAKRLKREDPSVKDLDISFDRETVRRSE